MGWFLGFYKFAVAVVYKANGVGILLFDYVNNFFDVGYGKAWPP